MVSWIDAARRFRPTTLRALLRLADRTARRDDLPEDEASRLELLPVILPTLREADGLAMSSRNRYLDAEQRSQATILFRVLSEAKAAVNVSTSTGDGGGASLKTGSGPGEFGRSNSTVTTCPSFRGLSRIEIRGASWIWRPTPCPVP